MFCNNKKKKFNIFCLSIVTGLVTSLVFLTTFSSAKNNEVLSLSNQVTTSSSKNSGQTVEKNNYDLSLDTQLPQPRFFRAIDVLHDDRFNKYNIPDFLSLPNYKQLLMEKVFEEKEYIFHDASSIVDVNQLNIYHVTQVSTSKIETVFECYINENHIMSGMTISFYGFTPIGTYVCTDKVVSDFSMKNQAIPQCSVLKNNKPLDKSYLFSDPKTDSNVDTIYTLNSSEIDKGFLQEIFNKLIMGNKTGITYESIDSVKLQFDNTTGKIYVYAIALKQYYDSNNNFVDNKIEWFNTYKIFNAPIKMTYCSIDVYDSQNFSQDFKIEDNFPVDQKYSSKHVSDFDDSSLIDVISDAWLFNSPASINDVIKPYVDLQDSNLAKIDSLSIVNRDLMNGTITIVPTFKNIYIQNIFYDKYTFEKVILSGFYAEKDNTVITDDSQEWKMKASDVISNPTLRDEFLEKFFAKNIKYPASSATYKNISILNYPKPVANNRTGELGITLQFDNLVLKNGQIVSSVKKELIISGFDLQYPTEFNNNITIDAPIDDVTGKPININDQDLEIKIKKSILDIFNNESTRIADNVPKNITENDFAININSKDIKNKRVLLTINLYDYYDKLGILVQDQVDNPLTSSIVIMQNFTRFEPTKNDSYIYDVKKNNEIIPLQYFQNPNTNSNLKQIVFDSLLERRRDNKISLPESFAISDFSIYLDSSKYTTDLDIAYGTGKIYLVIDLYKYYNNVGIEVSDVNNPLKINIELYGWKKFISTFTSTNIQITLNKDENFNTDIDLNSLKKVIWTHKNEVFNNEIPYYDDEQKFKDNINVESLGLEYNQQSKKVDLICKITLLKYFNDGSIGNNLVNENIRILGFNGIAPTKFFDGTEIAANITDLLPSDLMNQQNDIQNLNEEFKNFIIDKIVLPNKIGITKKDIVSVKFSSPNNLKGTIVLEELVINAYVNYGSTKQETHFRPNNGLIISGLKIVQQTIAKVTTVDITEKNLNISSTTDKTLLRILREDKYMNLVFGTTLPNIDSIGSVKIIEKVYFNDQSGNVAPYIKTDIYLNSYFDENGIYQTVPDAQPKIIRNIIFTGFKKLEPTQLGVVYAETSVFDKVFSDIGPVSIKMFLPSVIDDNWLIIQEKLMKLINICYELYPNAFKNVNIVNDEGKIAFANKRILDENNGIIYADPQANWDFISDNLSLQQQAKDNISSAAKKAIENPDLNNDFSWGKMQFKLRMINGLTINKVSGEIINDKLDNSQSLLTINCSGFSVNYNSGNATSSNTWVTIVIISSVVSVLVFIALIIYKIVKRKQDKALN